MLDSACRIINALLIVSRSVTVVQKVGHYVGTPPHVESFGCFSVSQWQIVPRNVVVADDSEHLFAWHEVNAEIGAAAM